MPEQTTTISQPLGVGIIGLGEIGQFHLRGYLAASGARVVAVSDIDPGLLARTAAGHHAAAYANYEDLLEDAEVSVVSVCLPHSLHLPVTLAALNAGKHVLIEKPLAMTVAEADQIIAAADAAAVTVGLQHNQIFYPPHVRAKELIDSGQLGDPVHIRLRLGIGGKFAGWRADPTVTGGGLMHDAGVHRVYMARFLFGEVAEMVALTDREREFGEDIAVIGLRFANGALGVIDASYHGPPGMFDDAIEITCTRGALYMSGCEAEFEGFRTGPALRRYDGSWHDEKVPPGNWADSVDASVAAFVTAVTAAEIPPVTLNEGRRVLEVIESIHQVRPELPILPDHDPHTKHPNNSHLDDIQENA